MKRSNTKAKPELGYDVTMVDLNEMLTADAPDAIVLQIDGETMLNEIRNGDWIVVSRTLQHRPETS